jgi:hypothetical protein
MFTGLMTATKETLDSLDLAAVRAPAGGRLRPLVTRDVKERPPANVCAYDPKPAR